MPDRPAPAPALASAVAGVKAYLDERFPLGPYVVMVATFVAAASLFAQAALHPAAAVALGPRTLAAGFIVLGLFFHLRVCDDAKDAARDRHLYPDRVLSRGRVTLRQLGRIDAALLLIQLALTFALGPRAVFAWLAALLFSGLMRYEFFVPALLRPRIVLYALTHNPIVALLALVVVAAENPGAGLALPAPVLWLLAVASLVSLTFEVGRKVRAPGDERPGDEMYTRALGLPRAMVLLAATAVAAAIAAAAAAASVRAPLWTVGIPAGMAAAVIGACLRFTRAPAPGSHRRVEGIATLFMMGTFLWLAALGAAANGISWRTW
jgi:4-hydroxybenzoate polyprenyltransferase